MGRNVHFCYSGTGILLAATSRNVGAVAPNDFCALTDIQGVHQNHWEPQLRRRHSWSLPKVSVLARNERFVTTSVPYTAATSRAASRQ